MTRHFRQILRTLPFCLAGMAQAQDYVQFGGGYQSEDSFKLGEYSGVTGDEVFGIGAFLASRRDAWNADTANYWRLAGRNLGLDTRWLEGAIGVQGRWGMQLNWQELPHYRFDNPVHTPFLGAGTSRQQLPAGWVGASSTAGLTALQSSLHDVAIHTGRDRLTLITTWQPVASWSFTGDYKHETKKGNDTLGAIFGSTGGNPRSAILAAPVDYATDTFHVAMTHDGEHGQTSLFYRLSLFNNDNRALQWDNPFDNNQWAAGAGYSAGAVGEMALAPDNRYWQTGVSSLYRLSDNSRLSGSITLGEMRQDEPFLAYSNVFTTAEPLPVTSLNGKVNTLNALINFSTRMGRKSALRLRYSLDDRDNNTAVNLFLRIPGDAAAQGDPLSSNARRNRPYSYRNQRVTADMDYRLSAANRLSFGLEVDDRHRNRVDVERTREHTGTVKLSLGNLPGGKGWLQYARARRTSSDYVGNSGFLAGHNPDFINTLAGDELFENDPLLRRFHLARRDRNQLSANINVAPAQMLSFDVIGKLTNDEFPDSAIGVQDTTNRHLTVNMNIAPGGAWQAYSYVTLERYENHQQGYSRRGGASPTPVLPAEERLPGNNWWMDSTDKVVTAGLGLNWKARDEKLVVDLNLNRSDARTVTEPFSTGQDWAPFDPVDTTRTTLDLKGSYTTPGGNRIGLRYRYEKFSASDFAFDQVAVDTLSNVILLGNASPNYSGHIVELTFLYNLPGN